ncbi:MAG: hypothetical protein Q8R53_04875 [Nanoarchaeota archaeon]|nr:hypothetical protein [Nanoarchaeota archaeon]
MAKKNTCQKKMHRKVFLWIIVLFFSLQLVLALGIRPAKTTIIFDELGEDRDLEEKFWVVNNDHHEFTARITVEGELAEFITINRDEITFRADDEAEDVDFEIHLPETMPPGESSANIIVSEDVAVGEGETLVSSRLVLKHKVIVIGPYPDKYLTAKLNFFDQGKEIRLVSEVENRGKLDIGEVQTKFYVNDKQQKQHVLETETTPLGKKENKLLATTIEREVFERGEFEVAAITTYDDQQVEIVKSLIVGQPGIDITYFNQFFVAYKINQYSLDLLNQWNKDLRNVFVDVEVKKDAQKIDTFRTKSIDLEGLTTERISDYFNAKDKAPGKYDFEMVVNFWNQYRMEEKRFPVELLPEDEFEALPAPALTGAATASGISGSVLALLIVFSCILLGIILFLLWRTKKKGAAGAAP